MNHKQTQPATTEEVMSTPTKQSPFPAQPYIRYQHPVEEFEHPFRGEEEVSPEERHQGLVLIVALTVFLWGLFALGYWVGGWQ